MAGKHRPQISDEKIAEANEGKTECDQPMPARLG